MLGNLRSDADGSGLLELQEILDSWQALQREGRNPNAPAEARRVKQVWALRTLCCCIVSRPFQPAFAAFCAFRPSCRFRSQA